MQRAIPYFLGASLLALSLCFAGMGRAQQTAPTPVGDVQPLLASLDQAAGSARVSLAKLRIERWKTQSDVKRRLQSDAQSIERNLTQALPALAESLRAAPQSLTANFAMYRNLSALHDVMGFLTQSAGAVAPEAEFEALAQDAERLDEIRRSFADRMEALAAGTDAEIARLQNLVRSAQTPPAPPKRIVVDDSAPSKAKSGTSKSNTKSKAK